MSYEKPLPPKVRALLDALNAMDDASAGAAIVLWMGKLPAEQMIRLVGLSFAHVVQRYDLGQMIVADHDHHELNEDVPVTLLVYVGEKLHDEGKALLERTISEKQEDPNKVVVNMRSSNDGSCPN